VLLAAGEPDPAQVAKGNEMFNRAAAVLEGQLKGRKFVTGDALTLADFALGAPLNYSAEGRFPVEAYPEIRRWHASLMALPAWQKTMMESRPTPRAAA
jgi:glutathione S-transferase